MIAKPLIRYSAIVLMALFASLLPIRLLAQPVELPSLKSLTHEVVTANSNGIDYDVYVWTPPGYEQSKEDYPLFILLDGAFFMGTAAESVMIQSMIGEAKPMIIVGVSTAPPRDHGVQRSIDYSAEVPSLEVPQGATFSFWEAIKLMILAGGLEWEQGFGGTDEFYAFLANQLLPKLSKEYRVDPDEIGLGGHSSGGDFTVDTLLRKDTPFSKFIVGSYGADVLEKTMAKREKVFARTKAPRKLQVFCGYGGAELSDPNLAVYIQSGIDLLERLKAADPDNLDLTIRGYDLELHGSVFHHIFSSGVRELWGTGMTMTDVMEHMLPK